MDHTPLQLLVLIIVLLIVFSEYRSYINVNNTAAHLTDLIVFSLAPNDHGELGPCCLEKHHFAQAREARAYKSERFPGTVQSSSAAACLQSVFLGCKDLCVL